MKNVVLFTLLFTNLFGFSQDWWEDQTELKGNVKEIYSKLSFHFDDEIYAGQDVSYSYTPSGLLYRTITIYEASEHEDLCVFDAQNDRCIQEYTIFKGDTSHLRKFTYNDQGQVDQEIFYVNTKYDHTCVYSYNDLGLKTQKVVTFDDGRILWDKFEYDNQKRKIQHIDSSDRYFHVKNWKYDSKGNLIELRSKKINTPNSLGLIANKAKKSVKKSRNKENRGVKNSDHSIRAYSYNEDNRLTKETITYLDGSGGIILKFQYNTEGDIIEIKTFTSKNKLTGTYNVDYTYDSVGNWTTKLIYTNGELGEKETREITYY